MRIWISEGKVLYNLNYTNSNCPGPELWPEPHCRVITKGNEAFVSVLGIEPSTSCVLLSTALCP